MDELLTEARSAYRLKDFVTAAELYGQACGNYASEHDGEEDPDLLFSYGRALFQVAKSNSSLLNGDTVENSSLNTAPQNTENFKFASEEPATAEPDQEPAAEEQQDGGHEDEPQDGGENDDDDDEDEDDDFTAAWKILDLVRVLLEKKLEAGPETKALKTKLAETHGLLGDISLEDDNYPQAVEDFSAALRIKEDLYPAESRLLSEAHYMLALAYEFRDEDATDKKRALDHMNSALTIAKSAEAEKDVVDELAGRVKELQSEVDEAAKADSSAVKKTDAISSEREAATNLLTSMLSGASDISTLVKKRPNKRKAAAEPGASDKRQRAPTTDEAEPGQPHKSDLKDEVEES